MYIKWFSVGKQCYTVDTLTWVCNINDTRGDGMDGVRIDLTSRYSVTWDINVMVESPNQ